MGIDAGSETGSVTETREKATVEVVSRTLEHINEASKSSLRAGYLSLAGFGVYLLIDFWRTQGG